MDQVTQELVSERDHVVQWLVNIFEGKDDSRPLPEWMDDEERKALVDALHFAFMSREFRAWPVTPAEAQVGR